MADADGGGLDAGAGQDGGGDDVGLQLVDTPTEQFKPKRRLRGCFFLLGMGSITFSAAVLQTADYMNGQYNGLFPIRMIQMLYTFAFLVVAATLFFSGPSLLPDKRGRMLYGYIIFLCALAVAGLAVMVEGVVNQAATSGQQYAFTAWAIAAAVAGGTEAVVASVLNVEAAALKCNFYSTYGRTSCVLLMVALRCISKAAIPAAKGDLDRLRLSASVHFAVAAAILLACVLVVAFAIPALAQQVAEKEHPTVPGGLNFQQTIAEACAAEEDSPNGDEAAASLLPSGTLAAMMPGMDSVYGMPVLEVTKGPQLHRSKRLGGHFKQLKWAAGSAEHPSVPQHPVSRSSTIHIPAVDRTPPATTPQLWAVPRAATFNQQFRQSMARRYLHDHNHTFRRRHSIMLRSNTLARREQDEDLDLDSQDLEAAATPPAAARAPAFTANRTLKSSSGSRRFDEVSARSGRHAGPPPVSNTFRSSSRRLDQVFARSGRHNGPPPAPSMRQARLLSTRNTQHHSQVADVPPPPGDTGTPRRHLDVSIEITTSADAAPAANQVDYVMDTSAAVSNSKDPQALESDLERRSESADTVGEFGAGQQHPQRGHPLVCSSIRHSETLQALSERGSFKDAEVGGGFKWDDELGPSPFHSDQLSEESSGSCDEGDVDMSKWQTVGLWWMVVRRSFAFQVLACIGPLMTGQLLPVAHAKQANSKAFGSYYFQIVTFAQLVGSLLGSQLMPTFVCSADQLPGLVHVLPQYPRSTLYGLTAVMLLFVPAFALGVHMGGPEVLIILVFLLFTYGGYINSLVFALTNKHMVAEDSRLVQMSMVLTASFAFFLSSCISWMWSFIKF